MDLQIYDHRDFLLIYESFLFYFIESPSQTNVLGLENSMIYDFEMKQVGIIELS